MLYHRKFTSYKHEYHTPTFAVITFSSGRSEQAMERNHIHPVFLLASLLATAGSLSQAPALSRSGEQQLANGQKDCFPGLVSHQRYNACLCVNATLFGSPVTCQTNQAMVEQPSFCITGLVVGGPYLSPSEFDIPEWKLQRRCEFHLLWALESQPNVVRKMCRKLQLSHQQLQFAMSAVQKV